MTIQSYIKQLTQVNQKLTDLNSFADMKTTKEERVSILTQWAQISKERKNLIQDFNKK